MMNKYFKHIAFSTLSLFLSFASFAQGEVEMADVMRENGKIYVVVAVLVIIFTGLLVYLISIDRRLRIMEKSKQA